MAKALYKTTIVIWTADKPDEEDETIVDLAQEATDGDAYCSKMEAVLIEDPQSDPDWDGTEFFE